MFRIASKKALLSAQKVVGMRSPSHFSGSGAFLSTAAASTPSVKDLLISLTFIDPSGARRKVTGLVGKSLVPSFWMLAQLWKFVNSIILQFFVPGHVHLRLYSWYWIELTGKTLHDICEMHGIDIGPTSGGSAPEVRRTETWYEPTFGEGATSGYDHVVLVGKGSASAARKTPIEEQMLEDNWDWDEIYEGSRLASAVVLTKDMDGMTVYVPDRIVDDIP